MQCNLFIIESVNVIGVSTDKHILFSRVWVQTFGRDAENCLLLKVYMMESVKKAAVIFEDMKSNHCNDGKTGDFRLV